MQNLKTMLKFIFCFLFISLLSSQHADIFGEQNQERIVLTTKRIVLEDFPGSHNPSLIKVDQGFLLTFRFLPDRYTQPWLSYIGVVLLDEFLNQISEPQLVSTRLKGSKTPSQSEDARIFRYRNRLFVMFNDSLDIVAPTTGERRDMYMAELICKEGRYSLTTPLRLVYEEKYYTQAWQKNWVPFEWNKTLLISYNLAPHEVLYANLLNGSCYHCYESNPPINWPFGRLRGSTPPLKIDGEFLAFFHSAIITESLYSNNQEIWHYFMGAYTFSADPPFNITKISPFPTRR